MNMVTALAAVLRHVLLPARQPLLQAAARPRPAAPGLGRAASASASRRASTSARRRPGSCRRPRGGSRRSREDRPKNWQIDRALEAGRLDPARDRPEGPARDADPDGALLRADRERRQARHAARRRATSSSPANARGAAPSCAGSRRRRPTPTSIDQDALAVVRDGLYQATHETLGTSPGVFGNFPIPIAGKTGTAEKFVDPGDVRATCSTSPGGAATGPRTTRRSSSAR